MSQENVELHRRSMDAFNQRDLDGYLALMDEDVEAIPRSGVLEGESSYRGHDGVRRWWSNVFDVFPDFTIEAVEILDLDDVTCVVGRLQGSGAGSTAPMGHAIWIMGKWRDGKCFWWRTFDAQAEAFEAVGLSEPDAHGV